MGSCAKYENEQHSSLFLDFHSRGIYFSAALGKAGASGGVLWARVGLVDDSLGIFGEAWQQDGEKLFKLKRSWQLVAPKSRQDAAKMASLINLSLVLSGFLYNVG